MLRDVQILDGSQLSPAVADGVRAEAEPSYAWLHAQPVLVPLPPGAGMAGDPQAPGAMEA